jgi:hypothetical protein
MWRPEDSSGLHKQSYAAMPTGKKHSDNLRGISAVR